MRLIGKLIFEFHSSCDGRLLDLVGLANFFRVQAKEELDYAIKLYDYIYQKNGNIQLKAIEKPEANYDGIINVFQIAYEHEQLVTRNIYALADIDHEERVCYGELT